MKKPIVLLTLTLLLCFILPVSTQAMTTQQYVNHRWRATVRKQLKLQHIWSREKERRILNIICHESSGHPGARNGSCVGLLQFNNGWRHNYSKHWFKKHHLTGKYHRDNRRNGSWSIYRIVRVYKVGGTRAVQRHWHSTYWR